MSFITAVERFLSLSDSTGFVVFSSTAPIGASFGSEADREIDRLVDFFAELSETFNVLMPTFPRSTLEAVVDLDQEPSTNGLLTERFRLRFPRNRTVSRFFPFTVSGPDAERLFSLRPEHAWGEGSLYSYVESHDLAIVTIGLPSYVCSVQHRAEYLNRDILPYRSQVCRASEVAVRGATEIVHENLLARKEGVNVDFRPISPMLEAAGQIKSVVAGIVLSSISAKKKIDLVSKSLRENPEIFVSKN